MVPSLSVSNPTFRDINTTNIRWHFNGCPANSGWWYLCRLESTSKDIMICTSIRRWCWFGCYADLNADSTGEEESDCGSQGGGRSAIYLEDSYVKMDNIDISQNSYGAFLRSSSSLLTNSTVTTKCNAIDTNSHLVANGQNYTCDFR